MAPTKESEYTRIAKNAEADVNTWQSKTGEARPQGLDEAGVNSYTEKKFPSSEVRYGEELSTNRGYNTRIPPEEGGDLDDRGRQATGKEYEGIGGPEDKLARRGGRNDYDVEGNPEPEQIGNTELPRKGVLQEGQDAGLANVGRHPPGPGGNQYPGSDYYTPESVPDSIAAQNEVPPDSVVQSAADRPEIPDQYLEAYAS